MQRLMARIFTSGMKKPLHKLGFSQILPRFPDLPLLFKKQLPTKKIDNNIRKYSPTTCFSRFIEVSNKGFGQGKPGQDRGTFVLRLLIL